MALIMKRSGALANMHCEHTGFGSTSSKENYGKLLATSSLSNCAVVGQLDFSEALININRKPLDYIKPTPDLTPH
ncbi:MAG TPA: hypothetical protein VGJ48_00495 [Pyrinomonadaceae bacterium]